MNCGLGNLTTLKAHLLPAQSLAGETRFDQVIEDIGRGTAAMMENFCNRKFARAVGDQAVFQADRASFLLPRYPLEAVSLVELKMKDSDGFVPQPADFIESTSLSAGIVYLPDQADAAQYWSEVRFTFTGGYFFEQLEPDDAAYPSALPAGATALPDDLKMAWLMQCREIWNKIDKIGGGLLDEPDKQTSVGELKLSPLVTQMLWNYRQMQPI